MVDYFNSEMSRVIDEVIHNEVHRHILKRRFIDHPTYEKLAEEVNLDVSTVKRIVKKNRYAVFKHIKYK